jgi:DNA-binding GntR family transcriptional regulator
MRANMTSQLEHELRGRILRQELAPGSRINEVHVAEDLGVSRTPLREALTRLEVEALVESRPKLGFYVRPLSKAELEQLYAIRLRLDPWAMRLAGIPPADTLDELDRINAELARSRTADEAIELDDAWHLHLLAGCPNRVLVDLIRQMMARTRRYEHIYFSDRKNRKRAAAEHAKLIALLRRKDLGGACRALEVNMSTSLPEVM